MHNYLHLYIYEYYCYCELQSLNIFLEMLCGINDIDTILVRVRLSILENEMAYNREMDKMLVAFKKRALWPDYFLMDDKSLIEQTLSKCKQEFV